MKQWFVQVGTVCQSYGACEGSPFAVSSPEIARACCPKRARGRPAAGLDLSIRYAMVAKSLGSFEHYA